jgi:hypothetical protein
MMWLLYTLLLSSLIPVDGEKQKSELGLVTTFDHQITGVSIHPASGRIFVNFPRWTEDSPVSVADVLSINTSEPYPSKSDWNLRRNARKK